MVTIVKVSEAEKENDVLVRSFEIKEVLPCFTTPGYIRFTAQADKEIGEIIPVIFLSYPPGKVNYSPRENSLTLRIYNRLITLFADGKVGVTNTPDIEGANVKLSKCTLLNDSKYRANLEELRRKMGRRLFEALF